MNNQPIIQTRQVKFYDIMNGIIYQDYRDILSLWDIPKTSLHRLLTANLKGLQHFNKMIYKEEEVIEVMKKNNITYMGI